LQYWKGIWLVVIAVSSTACVNTNPVSSFGFFSRQVQPTCEQLGYPAGGVDQLGFHDVYPGITLAEQLPSLLGEPVEVSRSYIYDYVLWAYSGFDVFLDNEGVLVDRVEVWDGDFSDLESLLSEYGCPDELLQMGTTPCDDTPGNEECLPQLTVFVYKQLGISAILSEIRLVPDSEVAHMTFDRLEQTGVRNRDLYTVANWSRVFRDVP
jgi:hypothetical protein